MEEAVNADQSRDWRHLPIAEQMQHLLQNGFLSDCSFLVGEDEAQAVRIKAHKLLLCRASEVFTLMFTGAMQEEGEVRVVDVSPLDFLAVLCYIYTEKSALLDLDMSLNVMMAAHKYLIAPLVNTCVEFAIQRMQANDVCKVLQVANLLENHQLTRAAIKMLQEKTDDIINSSSWLDAPSSFVLTVVQQDCLNVSREVALFTACERWARKHVSEGQTVRGVLGQFLPYLRLRTLHAQELAKICVIQNGLFTAEEILQLLQCLVSPEVSMVPGVCDLMDSRMQPVMPAPEVVPEVNNEVDEVEEEENNRWSLMLGILPDLTVEPPPLALFTRERVSLIGVLYYPLKISDVDPVNRGLIKNNKYKESFTALLLNAESSKRCMTEVYFEGEVDYGGDALLVCFDPPYILGPHTKTEMQIVYHESVLGKRPFFGMKSESGSPFKYPGHVTGLMGICQVVYKEM